MSRLGDEAEFGVPEQLRADGVARRAGSSGAEPGDAVAAALRALADAFDGRSRLHADPLGLVREADPQDREVVAHIAALLAYGQVDQLRAAIRAVMGVLGPSPRARLEHYRRGDFVRAAPDFVYRMTTAEDVDALLSGVATLLRRHGTLLDAFVAGPVESGDDLQDALADYVARLRGAMDSQRRGARYLTPDPATGSACKRWHLLLRWLVRADDGVDLGLWQELGAHRLLLPLDTHTARLVRALGLTERRTVDRKMSREATQALRVIDPRDPIRFDMALCHLGISKQCEHRFVESICHACPLRGICRWY